MPTLSLADAELHYEITGDGPPLVLIAGLASDAQSWGPIAPRLATRFTLIMPDNRGCGRTKTQAPAFSIETMADDVAALLDALSIDAAHVLGHSMGGAIAQSLAAQHPDRVRRLILAASAAAAPARTGSVIDTLLALRESGVDETVWHRLFFHWLFAPSFFENAAAVDAAIAMARAYPHAQSPADMRRQVEAIRSFNADNLPPLAAPTLSLAGEDDLLTPPSLMAAQKQAFPHSRSQTLSGAAHSLHWDQPEPFCRAVFDFFGEDGGS